MQNNRSFSRSRNSRRGPQNQSWNSNRSHRGFSRGKSKQGQATFDPTHVVLQSKVQPEFSQVTPVQEQPISNQFADFALSDALKNNIAARGYSTPTPIQDQTIPHIIQGRDVVGIANTGTGKTAAFLLPLIDAVLQNGQRVLIIAPTRELAIQVRDELVAFSEGLRISSTVIIGGSSMGRQIEALRTKKDFVIGTPGRIKDLHQRGKLRFNEFTAIVLDEVDRMLDMGFVHDIREIVSHLPADRQSLFFSATMTDRVQEIMRGFLTDPVHVSTKTQETSHQVTQDIVKLSGRSKLDVLHELLQSKEFEKVLVFGKTKRGAEKIKRELVQRGLRVDAIHGNKSQSQRQRALMNFRKNYIQALIATDVVARGLDIEDVTHVINYDLPESYETYIHRIGRTGRAQNRGVALTFVE